MRHVAVEHGHVVDGGSHADLRPQDLVEFGADLLLLTRDPGNRVPLDLHGTDPPEPGAGEGLKGHDRDGLDPESALNGGQRQRQARYDAVGVGDEAFVHTMWPDSARDGSRRRATRDGSAERTTRHPGGSAAGCTGSSAASAGGSPPRLQLTTSPYFSPACLSDAATVCSRREGVLPASGQAAGRRSRWRRGQPRAPARPTIVSRASDSSLPARRGLAGVVLADPCSRTAGCRDTKGYTMALREAQRPLVDRAASCTAGLGPRRQIRAPPPEERRGTRRVDADKAGQDHGFVGREGRRDRPGVHRHRLSGLQRSLRADGYAPEGNPQGADLRRLQGQCEQGD